MLIVLGLDSFVYFIIQYRFIYNEFNKHEQCFVNGYLYAIIIALGFICICLIIVVTLAQHKIMRTNVIV